MPRKHVKPKETPELFAKVFKVINGLKDKRSYITVQRIAKEIHAKLEQLGLKPESRSVLIQVRRALKYGVQKNLFLYKGGRYRLAIAESTSRSPRKEAVPLDSVELLKSHKSQRVSRNSDVKKHRCTRQGHTSSCRRRYRNNRDARPNKRYLSRKCKGRHFVEPSSCNSSKTSSNSDANTRINESTGDVTNAEQMKSESGGFQEEVVNPPASSDINHWDNKQDAINKSKYGKQSRKSRIRLSSCRGSASNSDEPKSRKIKKRKMKNLKEIENLTADNSVNGLSTTTAIAAAIMIMMSLWYGYR